MDQITMVVPIYNDKDSLIKLIELIEIQKTPEIQYLFVDNGSTIQGMDEVLRGNSSFWSFISLPHNKGFGGGILAGIKASKTQWIGWMPGNLKIIPSDVEEMVRSIQLRPGTLIKCKRRRSSKIASIKTVGAGLIQTLFSGKLMFDTGGTPTVCEKTFIDSLEDLPKDYVLESRVLYEARRLKSNIQRPKINYGERLFGNSHWQRGFQSEIKLLRLVILDCLHLVKRDYFK